MAKHMTDMTRARKFAIQWALRDSSGEIANLARAFLRASEAGELLARVARACDSDGVRSMQKEYDPVLALHIILGWPEGSRRVVDKIRGETIGDDDG